ncbi:CvfB family protein [Loigolactobacillus binensis]|uniref:S1 RNA-binding domain-containing protein n=1 Tax=Loigolactobacillus binensis TaxID=2559922 RepID=A0ABW3ECY4_9LACO|nr:S1-like domain-containing RNA-binding protein [Loigolactobacillus binensis]
MTAKQAIGQKISVTITDENQDYYFAQREGFTYRIAKSELEKIHKVTDAITGFAYENEDHDLQLTTKIPRVQIGRFDFAPVVAVRHDLGVFVDIGLPNKDVVVSLDELPTMKQLWPARGDYLLVSLEVDDKERLWGRLADEERFQHMAQKAAPSLKNANINGTVYRLKVVGSYVFTAEHYLGFIHPSERDAEPRLGQHVKARVIGVRPDGILNLSLRPRAYEAIGDDAQMILAVLQHQPGQKMPYTDKSSPDAIKQYFGISKGQFKRALGHLMKAGVVKQVAGETILVAQIEQ